MEDISVDISSLGREVILTRLGQSPKSTIRIERARSKLLKILKKTHPIHTYLRELENEHVGKLCLVIFQEEGNSRYNQLRQSIAKKLLTSFPKAPLTILKFILKRGKLPIEAELDLIYQGCLETCDNDTTQSREKSDFINSQQRMGTPQSKESVPQDNFDKFDENDWMDEHFVSDSEEPTADENSLSSGPKDPKTNMDSNNSVHNSENTADPQIVTSAFTGATFKNGTSSRNRNSCYRNGLLNGLLGLENVREELKKSSLCNCKLCKYLLYVLENPLTYHDNDSLRIWASEVNHRFRVPNRQEDAEEFLQALIVRCKLLQRLCYFDTEEKRTCSTDKCNKSGIGSVELNRDIKRCPIDTNPNIVDTTENMVKRTGVTIKICSSESCKNMTVEDTRGTIHDVKEIFTKTPEVLIVSAKRFDNTLVKIVNDVYPSPTLEVNNITYYLKAVLVHKGTLVEGHYTTALNLDKIWMICNDNTCKLSKETPFSGYIFFYEKTPLHMSQDQLKNLEGEQKFSQVEADTPHSSKFMNNYSKKTEGRASPTPLLRKKKVRKTRSSEDVGAAQHGKDNATWNTQAFANSTSKHSEESVEVGDLSRRQIEEKLTELKIMFNKKKSLNKLKTRLRNALEKNHSIHTFLKGKSMAELKNICLKSNLLNSRDIFLCKRNQQKMRSIIYGYFFENYPELPLTTLKKVMNGEIILDEIRDTDKIDPVAQFLKDATDTEITEWTRKLGNKQLRNIENMRKWIGKVFSFKYRSSPLDYLKKFIRDELPEYFGNLKKDASKRKSGADSEQLAKKTRIEIQQVTETQEQLRACPKKLLLSIAEKEGLGDFLIGNPIIEAGTRFHEIMENWNQEEPCHVCEESWFEQNNARQGKNKGVCKRCREDKNKECPTFSRANEMIPGPQPEVLAVLNNIEVGAIRLIIPFVNIFKNKAGGRGYSGHSISFPQDISTMMENLPDSLPHPIEDLKIILVRESKSTGKKREFKVSGTKIRQALEWLIENCPDYQHIKINEENLAQYPTETDDIDIPTCSKENAEPVVLNSEEAPESGIGEAPKVKTKEASVSETVEEAYADEKNPFDNEDEELLQVYEDHVDELGDIPKPTHTLIGNLATDTIENFVKKAIDELKVGDAPEKVPWPEQDDEPVSDFTAGYFTMAFPHLFPDGMGDITKTRPGLTPTRKQWLRHLLRVDRRFAKDPLFILVVTNIEQKKKALQCGNLYVDRCVADLDHEQIKEQILAGNEKVLRGLSCMSSGIDGSQQMFSKKISMATSFLRHIRIVSNDTEVFNSFLTFSAADGHWDELHKKLPGHEKYIGKRLVKSLGDVEESERENCITLAEDYIYRKAAVEDNQDIVNEFFCKRMRTMWEEVLQPVLGGKYAIFRFEFQHRGCIHCHMVMSMENGPCHREMELAKKPLPKHPIEPVWTKSLDQAYDSEEEKEARKQAMKEKYDQALENYNNIIAAKEKMIDFNSLLLGVFAVHPELDFENWPAPYGKNPHRPLSNVLRESFMQHLDNPKELHDFWIRLVNRVELHKCKKGSCLTESFTTVKDPKTGENVKKKTRKCRFKFPFSLNGFKMQFNEEKGMVEGYEPDPKSDGDTLGDPLRHGASYRKAKLQKEETDRLIEAYGLLLEGAKDQAPPEVSNDSLGDLLNEDEMNSLREEVEKEKSVLKEKFPEEKIDTMLELLRNHPAVNNHIAELLILWGANVDQKCITSYDQLRDYLLKYVLKPEKASEFYTKLARAIGKKVDDDTPLNRVCQKVLMSCIGQRDMTSNECFLIAQGLPYVEFSHKPRCANLNGSYLAKKKLKETTDFIHDDDNWQEAYWNRENIEGYRMLCIEYEKDKNNVPYLDKHPINISLREFMITFTKKWKYSPANVFCFMTPSFRYNVKKGKPNCEEFYKNLLLQDKPGCTFENVGKNFESCEEEFRDFVENSPYCPELLKQEFADSQKLGGSNENKDVWVEGDPLYVEPEGEPERAPRDDLDILHNLVDEDDLDNVEYFMEQMEQEIDNPDPLYCNDTKKKYDPKDWQTDREALNLTPEQLHNAPDFINMAKTLCSNIRDNQGATAKDSLDKDNLNFKQRIMYDLVMDLVEQYSSGEPVEQLTLNASGGAGSGKTFTVNCISQELQKRGIPGFMKLSAPTGSAAFLVKGGTLHSLLRLPISNSKGAIKPLTVQAERDLQESFKQVQLLVIDEKSLIGQYMFYMINERLKQAKASTKDFGGISMILMGDFAQIFPVRDAALFLEHDEKSPYANNLQVQHGKILFQTHFRDNTIIFDEIMRQKGDQEFKESLIRLANGEFTRKDWDYFRTQDLTDKKNFTDEQVKDIKGSSIKVCARLKDTKRHNIERINALGTPIAPIKSLNQGKSASSAPSNEAGNLLPDIKIANGCRVLLTRNLWQEAGLTNGAVGEIKYIVYLENEGPPSLPHMIIVRFEQYIGPSYLGDDEEKCVPLVPMEHHWTSKQREDCIRKMLPIKPGYAISIHSSQGATLDKVIVDLCSKEFAIGLAYVACSRVRKLENLYFDPMYKVTRFNSFKATDSFKQRMEQDKRERASDARYATAAKQKLQKKQEQSILLQPETNESI